MPMLKEIPVTWCKILCGKALKLRTELLLQMLIDFVVPESQTSLIPRKIQTSSETETQTVLPTLDTTTPRSFSNGFFLAGRAVNQVETWWNCSWTRTLFSFFTYDLSRFMLICAFMLNLSVHVFTFLVVKATKTILKELQWQKHQKRNTLLTTKPVTKLSFHTE